MTDFKIGDLVLLKKTVYGIRKGSIGVVLEEGTYYLGIRWNKTQERKSFEHFVDYNYLLKLPEPDTIQTQLLIRVYSDFS